MSLTEKLVAPQIRDLVAYQSARRIGGVGQVYLNANESAFPPFAMPEGESWQRYPDFLPAELGRSYRDYLACDSIKESNVLAVRGADEAIDLLVRCYCEPRVDAITINVPTYSMYDFVAEAHQVQRREISLASDFQLDAEQNASAGLASKLIWICNPNNPTGNLLRLDSILAVAQANRERAFVVVDEAYIEFCPEQSLVGAIASNPNLIVLRTLSKAFALAAVRVGFVLAHETVIAMLAKLIPPYPMPDPSARIALAAISQDGLRTMRRQRDAVVSLRSQYREQLASLPCVEKIYPSETNFLLLKFSDSVAVFGHLQSRGIILRDQHHHARLHNHLRITIGTEEELKLLIDALTEYTGKP